MTQTLKRFTPLDNMRGFIFLLMVFDHGIHAYAANWGRFWFFRDYDRSYIADALYLFDQAALMPILFFTFGAYILPKLAHLGCGGFWKDRFVKYMIPIMLGIPLIVPLLSYPKFHEYENPGISYPDYWRDIFFSEKLQAGPYWVMIAILLYTLFFLGFNKIFPRFIPWLGARIGHAFTKPLPFICGFMGLSLAVYGLSDLRWGAPWWVGLSTLFPELPGAQLVSFQGSKMIMNFVYFVLGAGFMHSKAWENSAPWKRFTGTRFMLLGVTIFLGITYALYAHFFHDSGAFDHSIYRTLRLGLGSAQAWSDAFTLLPQVAPTILVRTSLMGALAFAQVLTALAFFAHFNTHSTSLKWQRFWGSAAACCWGIFIFHDPIIIWIQFLLIDINLTIWIKAFTSMVVSLAVAWPLTHYLLTVNPVKRVFELD